MLAKIDGRERIDGADMDDDGHAVFHLLHDDFGNFFSLVRRHRRPLAIGTQTKNAWTPQSMNQSVSSRMSFSSTRPSSRKTVGLGRTMPRTCSIIKISYL